MGDKQGSIVKQENVVRLIKNGKKGIFHALFGRFGIVLAMLIVQILVLFGMFRWFAGFVPHLWGGQMLFQAVMVIYLLNTDIDATAKNTWLIVMLILPVFGALLFAYTQSEIGHRAVKQRINILIGETKKEILQNESTLEKLKTEDPGAAALAKYVARSGCHPVYENTDVTYFAQGEDKYEELLKQLELAKEFIFLEYFIIDEGQMWGNVLEILKRKAAEGVEVRVMYDGTCEFALLPRDYPKRLEKIGIKSKVFSPVMPFVSTHYNYRDHRKILVIDGKVAFTGGVNLADEYINKVNRFGHWKDTAIMLKGEAVNSFTLMFLQMWNINEKSPLFDKYMRHYPVENARRGFVMPFGDCPLDDDKVGEHVYMDMLNRAQNYIHIMTPYLILDGEMECAIKYAAERGVDVSLILPGKPDKVAAYSLAKTHYASLLNSGVKIYEYTPGFVHAKVCVADDREAMVGTINLDYRSFYHHFECAAYMQGVDCIGDIEKDFEATRLKCRTVKYNNIWAGHRVLRVLGHLMKAVAPLM